MSIECPLNVFFNSLDINVSLIRWTLLVRSQEFDGCNVDCDASDMRDEQWSALPMHLRSQMGSYTAAVRKIGFTITSILLAISSAEMRSGVWYHRRAAPKMAQAAVVASSSGSAPGVIE